MSRAFECARSRQRIASQALRNTHTGGELCDARLLLVGARGRLSGRRRALDAELDAAHEGRVAAGERHLARVHASVVERQARDLQVPVDAALREQRHAAAARVDHLVVDAQRTASALEPPLHLQCRHWTAVLTRVAG